MAERTTPLAKLNGVPIGRSRTLDFREGSNVTITMTETDHEVDIIIGATSGGITEADVTFENLDANGDVGTGADQVAVGNHSHIGIGGSPAFLSIAKWRNQ